MGGLVEAVSRELELALLEQVIPLLLPLPLAGRAALIAFGQVSQWGPDPPVPARSRNPVRWAPIPSVARNTQQVPEAIPLGQPPAPRQAHLEELQWELQVQQQQIQPLIRPTPWH